MESRSMCTDRDSEWRGWGSPPAAVVRRSRRPAAAFSLIEVVAALTILILIAGTIFAVVSGATEAGIEIESLQKKDRRLQAFFRLFRDTMATYPPGATLELKVVETSPLRQELILRGDHEAFVFGADAVMPIAEATLALHPLSDDEIAERRRHRPAAADPADSGGPGASLEHESILALSTPNFFQPAPEGADYPPRSPIKRREGAPRVKPDPQGRFWLELLPELAELEWRFYHPGKKKWLEKSPATRPPMIELKIRPIDRQTPIRILFRPNG